MEEKLNLKMPAEWEHQEATWLAWPHHEPDWPGKFPTVQWIFLEIIRHITAGQKLKLLVNDTATKKHVLKLCKQIHLDSSNIEFFITPTDRGWMRDCGPIFVKNGKEKIVLDFKFNGWAKYANHKKDDKVPELVNKKLKLKLIQPVYNGKPVVIEGGAIDVNGKGLLLTTEECLQSNIQCRNKGFSKDDYLNVFNKYLGVEEIIWLKSGIEGDDTHGHVDDITRFVSENVVITAVESSKKDKNSKHLGENLKILRKYKKLEVIELPMPQGIYFEDYRLPASYANFLITNKRVIVPVFNDVNDRIALNIVQSAFKGHEVVGINATDLVLGLGTIHCLTQQEPA